MFFRFPIQVDTDAGRINVEMPAEESKGGKAIELDDDFFKEQLVGPGLTED
jgi:hypothetical protein